MLAKGKAPKVLAAAKAGAGGGHSRGETDRKIRVTRPVRAFIEKEGKLCRFLYWINVNHR